MKSKGGKCETYNLCMYSRIHIPMKYCTRLPLIISLNIILYAAHEYFTKITQEEEVCSNTRIGSATVFSGIC